MTEEHDPLIRLHAEVDAEVRPLERRLGDRLNCGSGCADCCVDDLTVFEIEADRIRRAAAELLANGEAHPAGACAFLDPADRSCRIYADRPYVCRTQGLPLRWIDSDSDEAPVEYRDICPLNEAGEPALEGLPERDCWTLGRFEGRLATLQIEAAGAPRRVALRALFRRR